MAKKKTTTKTTKSAKTTKKATKKTTARKKSTSLKKLNETGNRKSADRRKKKTSEESVKSESTKSPAKKERRKVQRRRQIDPTTCERDYNDLEIEFMHALDEYKRASGRMFPTCSEILEVIMKLGYRKMDIAAEQPSEDSSEENQADLEQINDPAEQIDETFDSIEQLMM